MGDFGSGLPVRSFADGSDERLHAKICDGATPAQMAAVDTNNNLHVSPFGVDPAAANKRLLVSELGAAIVDGVYHAMDNTDPANFGLIAQERNATADDTRQTMQPTAVRGTTASTHVSLDVALHDEDGESYSTSNPLPVVPQSTAGTRLWDYQTSAAVTKKTGTANHDYTLSGNDMVPSQIMACASGAIKIELQHITSGPTYTTFWSDFNSTANPKIVVEFKEDWTIPDTEGVRIKIYNLDEQDQDVYSALEGDLI